MANSSPTNHQIFNLISEFKIDAKIASVSPFGTGHINDTYRIINADENGHDYLLQRINHHVFKDVPLLMNNLVCITAHLKEKLSLIPRADLDKEVLTIIQTKEGKPFLIDSENNYWRVFYFLKGTKSYDQVETEKQAFEGGKAFGRFQALLSDMDTNLIKDTIRDFHNIEYRLANLYQAVKADNAGRLNDALSEVEFIRHRADEMGEILRLGKSGILPLRIVHNDSKFNNVLLDSADSAQCVIDLDTVMPGYVAYDFGDSVRTIINTTSEDEPDLDKIGLNIPLFEAYTRGYLQQATDFLTETEVNSLIKGVLLLPYIQAVRFLTDYLEGDHYFKTHFPGHNLQRAKAQLTLVKRLEEERELLKKMILDTWKNYKS